MFQIEGTDRELWKPYKSSVTLDFSPAEIYSWKWQAVCTYTDLLQTCIMETNLLQSYFRRHFPDQMLRDGTLKLTIPDKTGRMKQNIFRKKEK
ncbi:MAG: hypothetical protein HFE84_10250 [Lachnospiraceae bacterium]|nr:hypothetical protein [Lachnospiraceae bacterium]